jgi:hypothetical protein
LISCGQGRILKFVPSIQNFWTKSNEKTKFCFIPIAIHCGFVDMDDQAWSSSAWPSFDFGVCGTDHREFGLGVG